MVPTSISMVKAVALIAFVETVIVMILALIPNAEIVAFLRREELKAVMFPVATN